MNIEQAIHVYRELKSQKALLEAEYKQKAAPIQEKLDKIESCLLNLMQSTGCDSFKTSEGTAYKSERIKVTCSDKSSFMDFVQKANAFELLEVRPSKTAVEEYYAGRGVYPPGLDRTSELVVNVRKS